MSDLTPKLSPVRKQARLHEPSNDDAHNEFKNHLQHILQSKLNIEAFPIGNLDTMDYRVQSLCGNTMKELSLWHDIPIFPTSNSKVNNIVNMVNEVILRKNNILLSIITKNINNH